MNIGKTIQIFLPDGNPRSVKIAEITSRNVQGIFIPRSKLDFISERMELKNVGVYFLIGASEDDSKPLVYVGEAEDCLTRLKHHNKEKDFWTVALAVISLTKYFTKTHIKYLEWFCHQEILRANRYRLENSNIPNKPYISESMQADLLDNFDTMKILVSTLGYPLFDQIEKPQKKEILMCKGKDAYSEGEYSEDGLVVFKGSTSNLVETNTIGSWVSNLRRKLVEDRILVQENDVYVFTSDYIFNSPSAAAAVVLARAANGWAEWKYKDGRTLDEVKRQVESDGTEMPGLINNI
ncbi:MAG: GIY-YIG nuclease family protein [Pyrinomonadaceae bacterium]|nr:GIY-YIG nuclease family protein [Pyrinomonadaceae bacterium]